MSTPWYTIFGPRSWLGVEINTGNKKIDAVYYNLLSDNNVQLAASGVMWLVAGTGIRMITPGYVDVSGLRAHTMLFGESKRIDISGQIIPTYSGSIGSVVYKTDDHNLAGIPNNELVYNTGLGKLTMPSKTLGVLYVSTGNVLDGEPPTKEIESFPEIVLSPNKIIPPQGPGGQSTYVPAYVSVNTPAIFTSGISIHPNLESYKGSILTHMGEDKTAEWSAAPYLKADGVTWTRFPKRPIFIDGDRIIFYSQKPDWAQDWVNTPTPGILEEEFGIGEDTVELVTLDREVARIKFATTIRYGLADVQTEEGPDLLTPLSSLFSAVFFDDPDSEDQIDPLVIRKAGIAVKICSPNPFGDRGVSPRGYAFSVTKGAYLSMQLSPDAIESFSCISAPSPFRFKPSTSNNISIRPNINTGFNLLAENIDFAVFGQRKTKFNNYEEGLFNLDDTLTPTGLIPAFKIDANIPNAASGSIESGVYYTKFLDRARLNPSGWSYDENPKITINSRSAHEISSLATGISTGLGLYADLTVSGITYSTQIITDKLFLNPKPTQDNTSVYIANSLLTIDRSGRVISRIPRKNPTIPSAPSGIRLDPSHTNGIGNTEVSLVWNTPVEDGRSKLTDYIIEFSSNNGETWTELPNNLYDIDRPYSSSNMATIVGLSPLVPYQFRVAAQNEVGIGNFSDSSESITPGAEVPKKPGNLRSNRIFDETLLSNIELAWDATHSGADSILGYLIEESLDAGATWQYYNIPSALLESTEEIIFATESEYNYTYRISAWNSYGQSAFAYIYVPNNLILEVDPEEEERQEEKANDVLSSWDFGVVLFTGVCPT